MKLITLESLKIFLDELNKKYGMEFYNKAEINRKIQELSGTAGYTQAQVDAMLKEMERRIPSYRYEVKLVQKPHQTITATVGEETYTETFLIERGADVTFSIQSAPGYIPGTLNKKSAHMTQDVEITATDAIVSENLEPGSMKINERGDTIHVPPKVNVLKLTFGSKSAYVKVLPEKTVEYYLSFYPYISTAPSYPHNDDDIQYKIYVIEMVIAGTHRLRQSIISLVNEISIDNYVTVSWSKEINEHACDYDLTV